MRTRWLGLGVGVGLMAPGAAWASACDAIDPDLAGTLDCEGTGRITNVVALNSLPYTDLLNGYAGCPEGGFDQDRHERIHPMTCDFDQVVTVRLRDTQCDIDLYVLDDTCDPTDGGACLADNVEPYAVGAEYTATFLCEAGRTYYVVVEAWAVGRNILEANPQCPQIATAWGNGYGSAYRIIALCPEECTDGNDNDKDLTIDCDDADCDEDPACNPPVELCDVFGDEDGDGLTDCADPDCHDTATCCDRDGDGVFADLASCGFGGDCADADDTVYEGAAEVVGDGTDQDCDGQEDCWRDFDGDGWGSGLVLSADLDCADEGEALRDGDCDDFSATTWPGAPELVANGVFDDCAAPELCWRDGDRDGWGGDVTVTSSNTTCGDVIGEAPVTGDCADGDGARNPDANELVGDGVDQDCDGQELCYRDVDLDGHAGSTTLVSPDADCGDPGEYAVPTDCRDDLASVYPGATEVPYDGVDQDCSGLDWTDVDGDGVAGGAGGADCDDGDATIKPNALEIPADGIDQDCDGVDRCWRDDDGDGFGRAVMVEGADLTCTTPGVANNTDDCDDGQPTVNPDAEEIPGNDNFDDCAAPESCWYDADGDGAAGMDTIESVNDRCGDVPGEEHYPSDCDDEDASRYPLAIELVGDGVDQDCDGGELCYRDVDGDGYGSTLTRTSVDPDCADPDEADDDLDCDDTRPDANPEGVEVPYDGVDQDCVDGDLADIDGDGAAGGPAGTDCADGHAAVRPGATEVANGVDDDCDGVVDEGTVWRDDDGDGFTEAGGDCADADADVHPGALETPDGVDEDCDGRVDEGTRLRDDDGDGQTEAEGDCNDGDPATWLGAPESATSGADRNCDGLIRGADNDGDGYTPVADCDDAAASAFPGAEELPNGRDDDCDGEVDEGTVLVDDDGDSFTESLGDCDDLDPLVAPGAIERPNRRDDDCDGLVDEGTRFFDDDTDGFTETAGDCDDADVSVRPDATERGNGEDDDCDGLVDEGVGDADEDGWTVADGDCDDGDGFVNPQLPELCGDKVDNDCDGKADEDCEEDEVVEPPTGGGCSVVGAGGLPWIGALLAAVTARRRRHRIRNRRFTM